VGSIVTNHCKRSSVTAQCLLLGICLTQILAIASSRASSNSQNEPVADSRYDTAPSEPWYKNVEAGWGGQIKVQGFASWVEDESIFQPVDTETYYDGNVQGRLKSKLFFGKRGSFETHYEVVLAGGDTRSHKKTLEGIPPDLLDASLLMSRPLEDDRRLMDLTKPIDENDDYVLYHRLDRLSLTWLPEWGVVRIGRQAVTWGNGLLFNPMDLFNPFSPADIERDYKTGDDIVSAQFCVDKIGDFQFLYVPRRNPSSGDVAWDQNSLAGKLHLASGTTEFDVVAAKHYRDAVVGLGSTGYLGDAAWRLDATWTFLDEDSDSRDYLSLVANMDYSWAWWEKNCYGFLEFFYNGLGDDQYTEALSEPDILERLDRGELFTLGRAYVSGHIRVELHPLFNVYLTVINNLTRFSGILQPRTTWDIAQDLQMTFGGTIFYGGRDTEYGGFKMPGTDLMNKIPDSAFFWLTCFF